MPTPTDKKFRAISNTDLVFPDLRTDTLVLTDGKAKVACEEFNNVCLVHLFIPEENRDKASITEMKQEFFPWIKSTLLSQYDAICTNISPDNKVTKSLIEEIGFKTKTVVLGWLEPDKEEV